MLILNCYSKFYWNFIKPIFESLKYRILSMIPILLVQKYFKFDFTIDVPSTQYVKRNGLTFTDIVLRFLTIYVYIINRRTIFRKSQEVYCRQEKSLRFMLRFMYYVNSAESLYFFVFANNEYWSVHKICLPKKILSSTFLWQLNHFLLPINHRT